MDTKLKIYVMDVGWRGSIVVVAESEAVARTVMSSCYNYDPAAKVAEHEIKDGFLWCDFGDC